MTSRRISRIALALASALFLCAAGMAAGARDVTLRTVYVTVTDGKGGAVTDLTTANFTVREGGQQRTVVKAGPAGARMRLTLLVEDRLGAPARVGLYAFAKRIIPAAEIALVTVGLRNETVVDFTADLNLIVQALNDLRANPQPVSNLTEGILDLAGKLEAARPERPVIVVVALSGTQAGGPSSNTVLTRLRQSGATMHAVTLATGGDAAPLGALADESGRDRLLGDGTRQSGGRRIEVLGVQSIEKALQQVADDLLAQYAITYELPDGVKPDRRFSISVNRRGVSLRAPTAIPDR